MSTVAAEVAVHARAILLADMRARRRLYERLGMAPDATVDAEAVEEYFPPLSVAAALAVVLLITTSQSSQIGALRAANASQSQQIAGLNKQLVYHYFGSKDDLYLIVLERVYAEIREQERGLSLGDLPPDDVFVWHFVHELTFAWPPSSG